MSSINAGDRNTQTDEIRRIREDYEAKEADGAKKKNKEISSLNEHYDHDLDKIKDAYNEQLQTMRGKQSEILDQRDRKHSADVNRIREMYVESLRRKSQEDILGRTEEKRAFTSELDKTRKVADQQKTVDERNFRDSLSDRDRDLEKIQRQSINEVQTGLQERTKKLNEKNKAELDSVSADRDREVSNLRNTVDNTRSSYRNQLAEEKLNHQIESQRRDSAFASTYRNQEQTNSQMIGLRDSLLKEERQHLNDRVNQKISDENKKMEKMREEYGAGMENRTGNMIKEARAETEAAKNNQILDSISNHRLSELDHDHLVRAYQEREEDLTRQKDQVFAKVNEVARDRVNTVIDRTDKLIGETNRRGRQSQDIQSMRTREALAQSELIHKDQLQTANVRADQRMRKLMTASRLSQKDETRQHMENVDGLRENYANNLQNQREAQVDTMKTIYSRMDEKLRDLEAHLMKKHDDAVDFYETKINDIVNQQKKETQRLNQIFEGKLVQRDKAAKMEQDTITQKFEQKLTIQEDIHQKDMNRLEKRHQEQMQAVVTKAAAQQNRKA